MGSREYAVYADAAHYIQNLEAGAAPIGISPEGINGAAFAIAPDGKRTAAVGPDLKGYLFSTDGAPSSEIPGFKIGELPIGWTVIATRFV
jgi:hypothetical protein